MVNTSEIYATSLKGYCSVKVCWQFLYDVADQLAVLHTDNKSHGSVTLRHVRVDGSHFRLCAETQGGNQASDIWNLAASAMELFLGSPILNGAGEKALHKNTPIPILSQDETATLNRLLHRCLNFNAGERPRANYVRDIAKAEVEKLNEESRAPRIHTTTSEPEMLEKFDKQWPESMLAGIRKVVSVIILGLLAVVPVAAQSVLDNPAETETAKLREAVLLLRSNNRNHWNKAHNILSTRINMITLMDELKDASNDCALVGTQVQSLGINRMINELKRGRRVQNTGKDLLDGADSRFKYSIYEKGLKKGRTATYILTGRSGEQIFLIVPYKSTQNYSVELRIGEKCVIQPLQKDKDGITYYHISKSDGPRIQEKLYLKISNKDQSENAAFVVINHNYRN